MRLKKLTYKRCHAFGPLPSFPSPPQPQQQQRKSERKNKKGEKREGGGGRERERGRNMVLCWNGRNQKAAKDGSKLVDGVERGRE
jgi:hypothetical protein